ncbi:uncharacterized protein N7515_005128 [Penicillium bovifimosum]|uniref:Uncharacterized protein n=1 Tax=Penicillium bovifimosum TaxID=126998 RepID=A0A9W9H1J7_9EURO|nr:uncharacterized protein N7515_005128 [Penicillium bovifimosum]KAJ5135850.1 hypothetical protein N7515_005128 [Penicillium bovifimosum]
MPPTILLLGTCDTKLPELLYTKSQIETTNTAVLLMDISRTPTTHPSISIPQTSLLPTSPQTPNLSTLSRAEYITTLTPYAVEKVSTLYKAGQIHGILGLGGSCGTTLATSVMRDALPVGFPKLMVSTMASGDVGAYIGETDISMMYSVVDIAGRNRLLEGVLSNAAGGISGMARSYFSRGSRGEDKGVRIGISMFGVTTPGVTAARERLESVLEGCEVYVFHATGSGGRALERLAREGQIDAVLDLTTTEVADEVVGGVLSAGDERLRAATERNIPRVVSVGACDMVNFGEPESVPVRFREEKRVFHEHNATVTLMRTTKRECADIGVFIAGNLLRGAKEGEAKRTKMILPVRGISMLDLPGQPFQDSEANETLFSTLERELEGSGISVRRDPRDINDPDFAVMVADELVNLIRGG